MYIEIYSIKTFYKRSNMKNHLLIFGYGYTASNIAKNLDKTEWIINSTSRSKTADKWCNIVNFNDKNKIIEILKQASHILISIPPNSKGDLTIKYFEQISLDQTNIKWIGYLSSTSVYGDHKGAWVDEQTKANPLTQRGKNRLLAEKQWLKFGKKHKIAVNIFRLSGIYGIDRNALTQIKNKTARSIYKEGQVFSRIHVFDIANTIIAAMHKAPLGQSEIFNISDDHPCSTIEVNNYAAQLLKTDAPEIIDFRNARLTEMAKEFYIDNKRVCNKKVKEKLGISLQFPTYKEGLQSIANLVPK
jgi:dTDP-4-dehydrorhamnose reductase